MKGYVFLDKELNIQLRDIKYIEIEDPGFWDRNYFWIERYWKYDTEDPNSMKQILEYFKYIQLRKLEVELFCKAINFDLEAFIKNNKVNKSGFSEVSKLT
jgi:hypothetical protein